MLSHHERRSLARCASLSRLARAVPGTFALAVAFLAVAAAGRQVAAPNDGAGRTPVVRIHITIGGGEVDGTCVVIDRDDNGSEAVLQLLTSAGLFKTPDDTREPATQTVGVLLFGGRALDVHRRDVSVSSREHADVALIRITTPPTAVEPQRASYDRPGIGTSFVIAGFDEHGDPRTLVEHVRFESTLLAVGDRDASPLKGCLGAPAISVAGVFGVVRECEPGRAPIISLLMEANTFIARELLPAPKSTPRPARP